ncbi:ribosome maturation factor RimM [Clostridium tetani]|uniref:ribosome maturation factor RimM n=1 Tax=Clostridium tetani TaxID=1513 RepID=UPI000513F91C|nr:ribosome maturation factor RimM [Clostridium tetani]KGI41768.1 16S rRNA processing protein RimM [Clostridium tetani]RXI69298.1 16S rRNA processing protein RimM [Clostridium tetani]BDR64189.1 ribosome maturation factor RimM [Clostridium tetani]BDR75421.1 ribosome maturation factor RimM [Clostridium tetani]BDR83693.1 ribosome maturation factor RimM [Clostridium tetani]
MEQFLKIGLIINTHGLKGELKVNPQTDNIDRFKKLKRVYIAGEEKQVEGCKFLNDKVVLKIQGIDSIEVANKYRNKYIEVKREDAVELPEGRYYVADIIGCKVLDEDGNYLGKVKEVIHTKNNDVYWVEGKKELLIPVLKTIVVKIDIENEEIIIKPVKTWLLE